MGGWNGKSYGVILNQLERNPNRSDYILPRLILNSYFQLRITSRRKIKNSLVGEETISIYTDGSKVDCGVGTRVYSEDLDILYSSLSVYHTQLASAKR